MKGYLSVGFKQTSTEVEAGITPVNYEYPSGNVLRYGAVADGVTDNTVAISNAILVASSNGDAGAKVYFPGSPSEYVSGPIVITTTNSRVRFVGDGMRATRLKITGGQYGTGTSAIRVNTSDSSWFGMEDIQIGAFSPYESVIFINEPHNQQTFKSVFINANNLCDYAYHGRSGSIQSFYDCYTTGALSHNFFSENQSNNTLFLVNGGNNDVATLGIFRVESTFGGANITLLGSRLEGCTNKNLFSFKTNSNGRLTIIGSTFSNGAAYSVIQVKELSSAPRWTLAGCTFVNPPSLILHDVDTISNDIHYAHQGLDGYAAEKNWFFRDAYFHGTGSVNSKVRFQRTNNNNEFSIYARSQNDLRITDETDHTDILSITSSRIGSLTSRFADAIRTPPLITADQNNYSPGAEGFLRLSSDDIRLITGISGGEEGSNLYIVNVGTENIILANNHSGSLDKNKIITSTGQDMSLPPDGTSILKYDATSEKWRIF